MLTDFFSLQGSVGRKALAIRLAVLLGISALSSYTLAGAGLLGWGCLIVVLIVCCYSAISLQIRRFRHRNRSGWRLLAFGISSAPFLALVAFFGPIATVMAAEGLQVASAGYSYLIAISLPPACAQHVIEMFILPGNQNSNIECSHNK